MEKNSPNNIQSEKSEKCKKLKHELAMCNAVKLESDFKNSISCEKIYIKYKRECENERKKLLRYSIFSTY